MLLHPVISKLIGKVVVLASASPRRQEILRNVGLRFEVVPSWFKETLDKSLFENPYDYAVETAKQKALEVTKRMQLTLDGDILEKPIDKQDAYRMLSSNAFLISTVSEMEYEVDVFHEETKVKFSELSEELLWEYIDRGMLVEYVQGDFLNVVGFPLNHFFAAGITWSIWKTIIGKSQQTFQSSVNIESSVVKGYKQFPQKLVDLINGFKASKCLLTASKFKIFDILKSCDGMSAKDIAEELQNSVAGTERLLDACVSLGLLEKSQQKDSCDDTNSYLLTTSEYSLHGYVSFSNDYIWPLFTQLEKAVNDGKCQYEQVFGKTTEDLLQAKTGHDLVFLYLMSLFSAGVYMYLVRLYSIPLLYCILYRAIKYTHAPFFFFFNITDRL
uniref:Acetylserotonin O-methyltransferase-like n=1 Tax=Erpetoichthys calabaricus TaxID=27687 RepID=A0A8C4SMV1_ERPCA